MKIRKVTSIICDTCPSETLKVDNFSYAPLINGILANPREKHVFDGYNVDNLASVGELQRADFSRKRGGNFLKAQYHTGLLTILKYFLHPIAYFDHGNLHGEEFSMDFNMLAWDEFGFTWPDTDNTNDP